MTAGPSRQASSMLSSMKPPRIRRAHLRKYSWLPDVFRVEGSIISRILGPVLTVTIWSTFIAYLFKKGWNVTLTNSVIPVVAVVVGLILVFSTSYDRYYEGRKGFAGMTTNIRNLTRLIWINVSLPPSDSPQLPGRSTITLTPHQVHRKKVEVLKLCVSFAYAVRHYLREEDGTHYDDFRGVLPHSFAKFDEGGYTTTTKSSPRASYVSIAQTNGKSEGGQTVSESGTVTPPEGAATKRVRPKRSKGKVGPTTPLLSDSHRTVQFHPYSEPLSLPLPLLIAHEISRAIFMFKRDGLLETVGPAGTNAMNVLVQGMVDQMTAMERVANTPIPVSYRIHLKQSVTLYLFALPFTLIKELGWSMIPIVTVVAFTFMGIEGIADEIENPFGNDKSDLPLDRYCADLREEVEYMIERLPEGGEGMYGYDDGEGDD
ncbi:hypothetical protein JAAARDRAFT_33130 [Jaapia argillacea MUCL 33604]|uniref:Uncharacterized protein n=1 Tax=Jaapia argillacea MUCL 33604 TaxID=933084 RepID=A0A067Q079_9AGAM|nr:hypothetical protein JAAARDRAFT_33130 [Jaapia argillacea MUCL 33604]